MLLSILFQIRKVKQSINGNYGKRKKKKF